MLIKLKSGMLFDSSNTSTIDENVLERKALLVYVGEFESMDGPVVVRQDDIDRLEANHNNRVDSLLKKLKASVGANSVNVDLDARDCPPVQLDHSPSAKDTVGRVVGPLIRGDYELDDGTKVPALYGQVRFLGKENVERVKDGRWTHLSIGADLDKGILSELTVTPFPAAAKASLLSSSKNNEGKKSMDEDLKKKLKSYLTGHKKMSDEEADKELSRLSENEEEKEKLSKECDEYLSRMSSKKDDEDGDKNMSDDDEDDKEKKLQAARSSIKMLSKSISDRTSKAQLSANKSHILARLSRLRSEAKITPAEIKKINIDELSASKPEFIEATLKAFEIREPVVMVGQLGTIKAVSLSDLESKRNSAKINEIEMRSRRNMSLLRGTVKEDDKDKNLSDQVSIHIDQDPHQDFTSDYDEFCRMMDEGKTEELKKKLKAWMKSRSNLSSTPEDLTTLIDNSDEVTKLSKSLNDIQKDYDELIKVVSELIEIK
jgi:hypothetical protein